MCPQAQPSGALQTGAMEQTMKYLYVDNFRGFSNTYIPLLDINFLVGENSTGKTSLLNLLKLLSTSNFWFDNNFNTDEIKLGHFEDIVSITSADRSYFSVGIIDDEVPTKDSEDTTIEAFLLTFIEKDGLPQPAMYLLYQDGIEFRIKTGPRQIKYKQRTVAETGNSEGFIGAIFSEWVNAYKTDKSGKGYSVAPEHLSHIPLPFAPAIIKDLEENQEKRGREKLTGLLIPPFIKNMVWLAPVRTKPQRTYDEYRLSFSAEGDHTPYLIKKLLEKNGTDGDFRSFIEKFGNNSGLFESISIQQYGQKVTAPFELDVVLNDNQIPINFVGYGVSQSLPVIVELFARPKGAWYAIQQPEVHLHPKAQAALGDAFFDLAVAENKRFFIETHSDYVIDRLRMNYRRQEIKHKPDAQILFFQRDASGNQIYSITIGENGELPGDQPEAYRGFFIHETLNLLEL